MGMSKHDLTLLLVGALIVAAGVGLAFLGGGTKQKPLPDHGTPPDDLIVTEDPIDTGEPVLLGFKGDLALGGLQGHGGDPKPFVVGEVLTLDVESKNVRELKWTCNGKELTEKGQVWSAEQTREFPCDSAGSFLFEVRGRSGDQLTEALERRVEVKALKIESFDCDVTSVATTNRYLTGESCSLHVEMVEPMRETPYRFRYLLNRKPVKHPDDGLEWTSSDHLAFKFENPGEYHFKVEVKRADSEEAEDSMSLSMPIRVGDAVIYDLDVTPEHGTVGRQVVLDATVWNQEGPLTCRFGVLDVRQPEKGTQWIKTAEDKEWGGSQRTWIPDKAGVYRIRAEVRDQKGDDADDFWELHYTVGETREEF